MDSGASVPYTDGRPHMIVSGAAGNVFSRRNWWPLSQSFRSNLTKALGSTRGLQKERLKEHDAMTDGLATVKPQTGSPRLTRSLLESPGGISPSDDTRPVPLHGPLQARYSP